MGKRRLKKLSSTAKKDHCKRRRGRTENVEREFTKEVNDRARKPTEYEEEGENEKEKKQIWTKRKRRENIYTLQECDNDVILSITSILSTFFKRYTHARIFDYNTSFIFIFFPLFANFRHCDWCYCCHCCCRFYSTFFFLQLEWLWEWESVAAIFFILFFFRLVLCCFVSVCTRDRLGWNGWWWLLSPLTKLSSIGALMHTILNNFHSFEKILALAVWQNTRRAGLLQWRSTHRMMSTVFFFFSFFYLVMYAWHWLAGRQADALRSLCCAEKCKRNDNAQIYVYVCRTLNII